MAKLSISMLFAACVQWRGIRSKLTGVDRKYFYRWLANTYPEVWEPYRTQPALFRAQCMEVKRGLSVPPRARRLGVNVITRYSKQLVHMYLEVPEKERGTFQAHLDKVMRLCTTERSLRRYLGV